MLRSLAALLLLAAVSCDALAQSSAREKRIEAHLYDLQSGTGTKPTRAAEALMLVEPSSVNSTLRKKIARAFREQVLNGSADKEATVPGLVHWAGKYSTPILAEHIQNARLSVDEAVFEALVELDTDEAAEAIASMLGNFFNHDEAVKYLKEMGDTAEPVTILAAKSRNEKIAMGAIEILGEVGSERGLAALKKLARRGKGEQRSAAKLAMARLRGRVGEGAAPEAPSEPSDNPFGDSEDGTVMSLVGDHPEEGDWDQVVQPLPDKSGSGTFTPDPLASDPEAKKPRYKPARLPDSQAGSIDTAVAVSPARNDPTRVAVVTRGHMGGRPARGMLIDLRSGKLRRTIDLPPDTMKAALSPSGKRLATLAEEGRHGARMRIDIWELSQREPKLLDSWKPFRKDDKMFSADPMWAAWANEDQLLMQNRAGDLVLWDAVGAVAKMQWEVDGWSLPAISPGGNQVAATTPDGLVVFDLASGDTLAWFDDAPSRGAAIGFDPTGQRLACVNDTRVRVWNLIEGTVESDFNLKDVATTGTDFLPAVGFVQPDRLVVRGRRAIDVIDLTQRRVLVRAEHTARLGGGQDGVSLIAYVGHRRSAIYPELAPTTDDLESPEADPEEILALAPGAEVALDVRVGGGLDTAVREILTEKIEEAGLKLVANSPNKFVARKETKSEVVTYKNFHSPHWVDDGKQVNVNENIYTVTLFIDGEPAWRFMNRQGASHMLRTRDGESFQQASDRQTKASAGYYGGIDLPRRLVHPEHAGPLQTVKLRGG